MEIDIELYRRDIRVSLDPKISLSVIDIQPERPKGTLVFIHGYGGQATQWIYQLQAFSSMNYRAIAIDLRGHGRSDEPKRPYNMDQIQRDLESALDVLGVSRKYILIGHSFGGAIATEFATIHPNRVGKLVLIATTGEFRLNFLYRFLLNLPTSVLNLASPLLEGWLSASPYVMQAWYHDCLARWNGWNLFRDLTVPTLVIRGHRDLVFSNSLFEEVSRIIPNAEDINVDASAHMVMLERRQAVNRAIQRFIESRISTWREEVARSESYMATLIKGRPWLPNYDEGVPLTIAIPRVPLYQLLLSSVRRFPRRTAIIFHGTRISYHQLDRAVNRFANSLRFLGLNKGDRIMLLLPNIPQMVIGFFAALKIGAVAVFTLPTTNPDELIRQVKDSGAKILVTTTQFEPIARTAKSHPKIPLEQVIFTSELDYLSSIKRLILGIKKKNLLTKILPNSKEEGVHNFHQIFKAHGRYPPDVEVNSNDLAAIQYTGGTTSDPKGVMLSHRNLVANALQTRHWMPSAHEGEERFLCVIPISHSYGLTTSLNLPIALGASLILKPVFEVQDILKTIKRHRPTIFPGVPRMYIAIKDVPGVRKYNIASIKACISGSAPLPMEVQETFEKLTRGRVVEGYGLTEASPVTHANPLNGRRKVGSIGIPLPSTDARVVDLRNGEKEVPPGQIGELAVRGPQVMIGYWNNPEETDRSLIPEGWLLTGDVAQMDTDGYFRIIARKADMWYPSKPDKPAFPRDVEEVLFEIPQIKEAAVVAIAAKPIAFVIASQERPDAQSIVAYCKRRLPPELVPRLVIFVDEFPRTFIGKILRRELASKFENSNKTTI